MPRRLHLVKILNGRETKKKQLIVNHKEVVYYAMHIVSTCCYGYKQLGTLLDLYQEGCIQSLDWTSGLDWWTGLLDLGIFPFKIKYLGNWL